MTGSALDDADAAAETLRRRLGVAIADRTLLRLALTHRSHAFEAGGLPTNERLEFLGDAVLSVVVTEHLYRRFPDAPEGRLAKLRASAVSATSLADVARGLGVGDAVLLGRGEEQSGGRDKDSILADTFEALLGAIHLDQGLATAAELVVRLFAPVLDDIADRRASLDYKTSLQELTAGELATVPVYKLTEDGPDHDKRFTAVASVGGEALGAGEGRSKKEAEQAAAQEAYAVLQRRLAVVSGPPQANPPEDVGDAAPRGRGHP